MNGSLALEPFIQEQGVLILDGGLATELEKRGADLSDDLWSARLLLEDPASIRQLHLDYFEAGADVAISASYQASFEGFSRRGLSHRSSVELMQRSVRLAKEARDQFQAAADLRSEVSRRLPPLVAASVGSYGAFLADGSEYTGEFGLSKGDLIDWHRPRLEALLGADPDLLACETVPCLDEGEALAELLTEYDETPAWISFSCRDDEHVCRGEPISRCVELVNSCSTVVAAGLNCTAPKHVKKLLKRARAATCKPLVCYPNSGARWDGQAGQWVDESSVVDFAVHAPTWQAAGARLIGGCCRTSPDDIRNLRRLLLGS